MEGFEHNEVYLVVRRIKYHRSNYGTGATRLQTLRQLSRRRNGFSYSSVKISNRGDFVDYRWLSRQVRGVLFRRCQDLLLRYSVIYKFVEEIETEIEFSAKITYFIISILPNGCARRLQEGYVSRTRC